MAKPYKIDDENGLYFVTFSIVQRAYALDFPGAKDIIVESLRHCQEHKSLALYSWVIMSNHVHLIIDGTNGVNIIRDLKKYTSNKILKLLQDHAGNYKADRILLKFKEESKKRTRVRHNQIWIHNYHAVLLSNRAMTIQKLNYIHDNPLKAGLVNHPMEYKYSSAKSYGGEKGLLDITIMEG